MIRHSIYLSTLLCFLIFTACQNDAPPAAANRTEAPGTYSATAPQKEGRPAPTPAAKPAPDKINDAVPGRLAQDDPFVISGGQVLGIRPGDDITAVNNTKKTVMKTGDGDYTVYELNDDGGKKLGYLVPDPNDEQKIRSIHVTSDYLTTDKGISVGSTFEELEKMMGSAEVHGSEIEGRTYAKVGGLQFRLEAANFTYKLDKAKIKPGTKVTEVIIE